MSCSSDSELEYNKHQNNMYKKKKHKKKIYIDIDSDLFNFKCKNKEEKGNKCKHSVKGDCGNNGEKGDRGDKGDRGNNGEKGDRGDKGDKGDKGDRGNNGEKGDRGDKGDRGERGDKGVNGEKGDAYKYIVIISCECSDGKSKNEKVLVINNKDNCIESKGNVEPTINIEPMNNITSILHKTILTFSSGSVISNGDFFGINSTSTDFFSNSVLMNYNCIIHRIGFSIRKIRSNTSYIATIYVNNKPTNAQIVINNGAISISNLIICNLRVNTLDLINIKFESSDNNILLDGVCATLSLGIINE
jgi:hypothetical protein